MSESTPLLKEQPPTAPPPQGVPPSAPPPAYTQPQAPPPQQTTVVVQQQVGVVGVSFSDVPVRLRCPNCQNDVMTKLQYENGTLTWIIVVVLILLGFWLGCCLIPLCIDGLKDVDHVCPVCNHTCGRYKRM